MKVLVVANAHFYKTPDGRYFTPTIYDNKFFQRYLNVFDEVRFVAKTKYVEKIDKEKYIEVNCSNLEIYELPWYRGLKGMFKNIFKLFNRYRKASEGCSCIIYRVSQLESYLTYFFSRKYNKPFALEVINDPETFPNVRGIFKWINVRFLSHMVKRANGVSYVTKHYLQRKYPCIAILKGENEEYFYSHYSSIDLENSEIREPKKYINIERDFEIIHTANNIVGNIKGHKTLIDTLKILIDNGYNVNVTFIGTGKDVPKYKAYAKSLGIGDKVKFIGRLNKREDVLERLSKADLFVLPTYMEGLPRSIIEAQAVGLPCLSTPVAGVPELIEKKYLFDPEDSYGFAKEIIRLLNNPRELEKMSVRNIEVAKEYTKEKLDQRRYEFYSKLRLLTKKKEDGSVQ